MKWGDAVSLEYGKALRGYDSHFGKYRVYGSNGPIGWTESALAKGPGVILGRKGAYRGVEYSKSDFFVIDTAYYVVPKIEMDPRWLYYAIRHHKLGEIDDGSPIPSTTRAAVYVKDLQVPPVSEQREIAETLGCIDDKIEINRKMNSTLETMAHAIFKSWFIDFDPVHAKRQGKKPYGVDDATLALFPDSFEHSGIGPIPARWSLGTFGDLMEVHMGASPPGDTYNDAGLGMPLVNGPVEFGDYFTLKKKWSTAPSRLCRPGDLIFCVRGSTTGRNVIADDVYALGRGVAALRSKEGHQRFVNLLVRTELPNLLQKTTGSVFPNLSKDDMGAHKVAVSPVALRSRFEDIVRDAFDLVESNVVESRQLASFRELLLSPILSGDLKIKEALLG